MPAHAPARPDARIGSSNSTTTQASNSATTVTPSSFTLRSADAKLTPAKRFALAMSEIVRRVRERVARETGDAHDDGKGGAR